MKPVFKSTPTQFQTIIYANAEEEVGVKDVTKDVGKDVVKELSERQMVILKMVSLNSRISAKAMSEKMSEKNLNVERTIERDLAKLKKLGILTRKGGRKDGEWVLTDLGKSVTT